MMQVDHLFATTSFFITYTGALLVWGALGGMATPVNLLPPVRKLYCICPTLSISEHNLKLLYIRFQQGLVILLSNCWSLHIKLFQNAKVSGPNNSLKVTEMHFCPQLQQKKKKLNKFCMF